MSDSIVKNQSDNNKHLLIGLISVLAIITILYQFRAFLDEDDFGFISVPAYSIIPSILFGYSIIITIKLFKQKNYQAKAFLFFAIGAFCWVVAEHIWMGYEYLWEGEPWPSEADIFYLAAYPFFIAFLLYSLKPILQSVSRNVWLFAIGLSFAFLVPSISGVSEDIFEEEAFAAAVLLAYPILASCQLVPAIIGVMYLTKRGANLSWMLILFGFIMYAVADTFYVIAELDGSYYDGHPADLMYIYSFLMLIFALHIRFKLTKLPSSESQTMFFSENIKFDTISRFGIPLTVAIVCMVILISLINTVFIQTDEQLSVENLMLGVVAMLGVFAIIVITLNRNLSRLVKMRTTELVKQRDNLENLVEEKTHEVLKSERLSAIGELSGRLAHDLRNPLSVMKMSVDLIKQTSKDAKVSDPIVIKRIDLIEKSIDRISHQVDDVLEYVRNSPLKVENISVYELVKNSIEKINSPNDIRINVLGKDVNIDCDPVKLDAVFINLIVNSIQAMHDGGKIEIKMHEDGAMVILEFIDSGDGIPEENLETVFEPLFTTKQKGTGLGLASCRNIVEQHQGKISVKNNPTTFTVRLPKSLSVLLPKTKN
ncbi:MAG: PAS domain-containing sensor histidine kinase [Nitrosopumilus sp.]